MYQFSLDLKASLHDARCRSMTCNGWIVPILCQEFEADLLTLKLNAMGYSSHHHLHHYSCPLVVKNKEQNEIRNQSKDKLSKCIF